MIKEGFYSFIIVEYEGAKLEVYNKLAEAAKLATYEIYGIDVIQSIEKCTEYVKHSRAKRDIEDIVKEMTNTPIPYYIKVIDPIELVEPGWKAAQPPPRPKSPSPPPKRFMAPRRVVGRRRYYDDSDDDDSDDNFCCDG